MRKLYLTYPKSQTLSDFLSWSHYVELLKMQYALQNISNQIFVSRYQLYLPDRDQLEAEFQRFLSEEQGSEGENETGL